MADVEFLKIVKDSLVSQATKMAEIEETLRLMRIELQAALEVAVEEDEG